MDHERTNAWLTDRLPHIWQTYFRDIPQANPVAIRFGRRARARLGSIRQRRERTTITITGYFRSQTIPEYVVAETIAHELVHYAHGFESPLPKLYRYPHEGRIVQAELTKRGLGKQHRVARAWLKTHWAAIVGPPKQRVRRRRHHYGHLRRFSLFK
jgi:hypothetical protein